MTAPAWFPADPASTNVGRFMSANGIGHFDQLVRRSIEEPEWFWDAVVRFLGIEFATPYREVLDVSDGIPWARWFVGGTTNFARNCLRHPEDRPALVWEGEDGEVRRWTYGELRAEAAGLAAHLRAAGIGEGDAVGVFLPMLPETVATLLAVAQIGAVFLPL
ncbi:MAG: AMP-dependent synthetase and ligase, partial [Acidimicrobiales bacterium]|nr:AMP-dependent synthetase and ligase [Acidimicrobiales bacterium]